jgi:hypothetical protein
VTIAKDSARSAGLTFVEYLKKGYYCPKCFVQAVEPEYYSLYEFIIAQGNYRFVFHLPRSSAGRWLKNVSDMWSKAAARPGLTKTICIFMDGPLRA